jgi:hypothetical protein
MNVRWATAMQNLIVGTTDFKLIHVYGKDNTRFAAYYAT